MVSEEIIVKVRDFLILVKVQIPVESAYLFGSYVNGSPRPDSDIDVGIFTENPGGTYMEILKKLFKMRRSIDSRIEPHLFINNQDTTGFHHEVRQGIRII